MKKIRTLLTALSLVTALLGCSPGTAAAASAGTAASSASAAVSGTLEVTLYKAGSADAILIETSAGAVVIDTGESSFGDNLVEALQKEGITELKALILTHFDADHVGGAAELLSGIQVDAVYQSDCPKDSDEYQAYTEALAAAGISADTVRESTVLTVGDASLRIDPPQKTDYSSNPSNNSSLIIELTYGSTRFLFAGDAMEPRIEEYLSESTGTFQFLKVPYHGRWQNGLRDLLEAVQPEIAVMTASSSENTENTRSVLEDLGAEVYQTSDGTVHVTSDGTSLQAVQD
jgi:beta-lactamase superfamily II metal-dependent hydrolase